MNFFRIDYRILSVSTILKKCSRQFIHTAPASTTAVSEAQTSLYDKHGRRHNYLRISLTERCNLRCKYCMPAAGVPLSPTKALLTPEELTRVVRVFASLGVDKLRLTGGEPTVRRDLEQLISSWKDICGVRSVGLTTNGLVLTRRLVGLQRAGLDHLNVSVDSLRPERYEKITRRTGLSRVLAGVDLALQIGYAPVKINVVLMKGFNEDEICDFVELTRERDLNVRFIEFMPFSGNEWDTSKLVSYHAALSTVLTQYPALQACEAEPNDTAKVWQVEGYKGRVGFITSMTQHFCNTCNRMRLTADGNLKVCLFGSAEVSLRDALRAGATDVELETMIRGALRNKKPQHADLSGSRFLYGLLQNTMPDKYRRQARGYCTLSHVDETGRAKMVDVGDKQETDRRASASAYVYVSPLVLQLLRERALPKGDAIVVAETAGVMAAKRTSELLPLCHSLPLHNVFVRVSLPPETEQGPLRVLCSVRTRARTGVEMEALTGASVAALTLYDMCKSADKNIVITDLRLLSKTGGKSDWSLSKRAPVPPEPLDETYVPTNFIYL